jgi:MFS family permease
MGEFNRGARPLTAAVIGTMCGALTITTYSQAFFVGPVTSEFGWTVGQFFLGFTLMSLLGVFAAPLIGSLAQKYGIRSMAMIGLTGHAFGYVLLSMNPNSLMLWYATWASISFLAAGSLPIIWTSVLNGWFVKNRGKALGITMAGTGFSAFLLPPIVEILIANLGWRAAYQAVGIGALVIPFPFVFLWFREKEGTASKGALAAVTNWGMTRKQAIRTPKFWILGTVLFLTVFVIVGLISNFERILSSKGLERETIAGLAAIIGVSVIVGRLMVGALVDTFWAPIVAAVFFAIPIAALLLLINVPTTFSVGVIVAISIGLASGAELDLLAYLTGKYFGPKHYSEVFGGIFAMFAIGAGIAPPIFGTLASKTGSYEVPLYLCVTLLCVSIPLFISLGQYPNEAAAEV